METLFSICIGVGLSAAVGFRVFVPLLILSIASYAGSLPLSDSFAWVGTLPALIAFSIATLCEVAAYFIPWLDHLLDVIATPAAVVAGTVVTASVVADLNPFLQWSLAIIAGGGTAGLIQGGTGAARAMSTAATGGLGNPIFALVEAVSSIALSLLALLLPIMAFALALSLVSIGIAVIILFRRALAKRNISPPIRDKHG
jgi:hypothetical protein